MAPPLIIEVTIINPKRRHYVDVVITKLVDGNQLGRERFRARTCKRLRSPGIDSEESGINSARLLRLVNTIRRNRFLVSLNVYKFGLCSVVELPPFCDKKIKCIQQVL
jgi:hypothetical protein